MRPHAHPPVKSRLDRLRAWLGWGTAHERQPHPETAELAHITRDIDRRMADMALIARPNAGPATLMPERVRQLGLDPAYIERAQAEIFRELQQTCGTCNSWRRCARDLARGDATAGANSPTGNYCPNAALLDELLIERLKTAPGASLRT